jgi:hypothetical protein
MLVTDSAAPALPPLGDLPRQDPPLSDEVMFAPARVAPAALSSMLGWTLLAIVLELAAIIVILLAR